MKKLILLLSFVFIINETKAQWVTIPDANFVAYLQSYVPNCMNGNQMDTIAAGSIFPCFCNQPNVANHSISDLTGIQYLKGIDQLTCNNNQLTSLPRLPKTIKYLYCSNNQLTSLPTLPDSLIDLECYNNQLTSLPTLPNTLSGLFCYNNYITCFPVFPNVLGGQYSSFGLSPNPFHCLPNYVPAMTPALLAYPLCIAGDTLNNPNGCAEVPGIAGYAYEDNTMDCIYNALDSPTPNLPIKLYNSSNIILEQTYSLMNGVYNFPKPTGTYNIKIDTTGMPFTINCPYPGIDSTIVLTSANALQTNLNFEVACKQGFDIGTRAVVVQGKSFPGQFHLLKIDAGDLSSIYNLHCAAGIGGQVQISVTGPVTYYGSYGTSIPTVAGNLYTYNISDFGVLNNSSAFILNFKTDTTAINGDSISVNVSVTPTIGDNNSGNNYFHYCYYVGNSFDPNYKDTYPKNVPVGFDNYFYYTIHFQNTGSAAAINIIIKDVLDTHLDLTTFQITNSSNYCTTMLNNYNLSFTFPNINLPDSSFNFWASQGFVQYRIKPLGGLLGGTQIPNHAYIYFDYNAPIVTNTTLNKFILGLGINQLAMDNEQLLIYPNPTNGKFTIVLRQAQDDGLKLKLEITNILGEIVYQSTMNNKQSTIDISQLPKGIYFVRIIGGTQSLNQKIVKSN